ncbi:hypothetical protein L202_01985 [Cryptococcus amylolentus CBS 6039]|uniref:Uncharacterized protein n=1 Tax=Cryptococcus amylolentus CBS 6039 TaxID=1295533 RepID=A0A1E3I184_9TREE|nr:hypothetical protein L202_01985 [Cryptococcus amylolentus CBS 6039]ODN81571.1 hypothetical protein L202_01985 [Cryptococcus amylolentus CBS 6039]
MSFASSSRTILPSRALSALGGTRGVLHRARPPRMPSIPSPHNPKKPLPTSGTSHAIPSPQTPSVLTTASPLLDSQGLVFHHTPPPSAPSYKAGGVPDFLKWTVGKQGVRLSGEEGASSSEVGERVWYGEKVQWGEDVVLKMRELRAQGLSRKEIGDALQIPSAQHRLIPRYAPLAKDQAQLKKEELAEQKAKWGFRKRTLRGIREKRRELW